MHDLVDDAPGKFLERDFLVRRKRSQSSTHAIDLSLSDGFQMVLQRDNCRYDIQRLHPCLKALYFAIDDNFRPLRAPADDAPPARSSCPRLPNKLAYRLMLQKSFSPIPRPLMPPKPRKILQLSRCELSSRPRKHA